MLRSPAESLRNRRGRSGHPGEDALGGREPWKEGSRGGAGAPGRGLRHLILGFPRPSRRWLPTRRGNCVRSARNNPQPSCCIANKILMSPLPLPLGRRGPSAGCAPARAREGSRPCWPPARPPRSSSNCRSSFSPFPAGAREKKEEGLETWSLRLSPCATRRSRGGLSVPLHCTQPLPIQVPSFLFLPPPRALAAPGALSLHIVCFMASLLPSPGPGLQPGGDFLTFFFITYFDPASLCPRFLRKFYCPRSRLFD